ncbi:MAG: HEAT repeat domain-containing protein, partial [Planctomycetota bacterium]
DRREAEKTVTAVAHKIGDKNRQAEAVLAALPSVKEQTSRCSLLRVLGKIGDDSALAVLRAGLKDKSASVEGACIRALAEWPTAVPAADLLKVVQTSENKIHRVLALRGYVRLIGLDSGRPVEETMGMYKQAMSLITCRSSDGCCLSRG